MNSKLYRFRSISKYNLSALLFNEIWLSTPITFNDPNDLNFYVDKNRLRNYVTENYNEKQILNLYTEYFHNDNGDTNSIVHELIDDLIIQNKLNFKRMSIIMSLSEKLFSDTMWAHYSNDSQGFVIEYDKNEIENFTTDYITAEINNKYYQIEKNENPYNIRLSDIEKYRINYGLKKVNYSDKRNDRTEFFIHLIRTMFDSAKEKDYNNFFHKVMEYNEKNSSFQEDLLLKNTEWEYESEVRLILFNPTFNMNYHMNYEKHVCIGKIEPTAIYLGRNIENEYKRIIKTFCKLNEIKCYQIYYDFDSNCLNYRFEDY